MDRVLISREEAIAKVCNALNFSWELPKLEISLGECIGKRLSDDVKSNFNLPEFARSTRDGFAVRSVDTCGASLGAPVFLSSLGEVKMGEVSDISLLPETCAKIHTGGILPNGADAVVMLEDAVDGAGFIEVRRAVQGGENIIFAGEEYKKGDIILKKGDRINFSSVGVLAAMGTSKISVSAPKIGILSTGDEVVDIEKNPLQAGKIRDVNSWVIASLLKEHGYECEKYGIVGDDAALLQKKVLQMTESCDVVLMSGGSSVSERDHTETVLSSVAAPGLIVKGIRIVPGKPTLIAGSREQKRLLVGLPGHPLSCLTVMISVVLPLLNAMLTGEPVPEKIWTKLKLRTKNDIFGRTGVEEFIPCRLCDGGVIPMPSKSGYVGVLSRGFIRLGQDVETVRTGEEAEVLLW